MGEGILRLRDGNWKLYCVYSGGRLHIIHIGWMGDCWILKGMLVDSANSDRQFLNSQVQNNKDIPLQIKHATDGSQRVIPNCRQ